MCVNDLDCNIVTNNTTPTNITSANGTIITVNTNNVTGNNLPIYNTVNTNCCAMRSCQERDTIYSHTRSVCIPAADHLKINKTNGEFCSYTCQI